MTTILLDDLNWCATALIPATAAAIVGAWCGRWVRSRRTLVLPAYAAAVIGLLSAVALFGLVCVIVLQVGLDSFKRWPMIGAEQIVWISSDFAGSEFEFSRIAVLGWYGVFIGVPLLVAFATSLSRGSDNGISEGLRFSLGQLLLVVATLSVALAVWEAVRRPALAYARAYEVAQDTWGPRGFDLEVNSQGDVCCLIRRWDAQSTSLNAPVMRDIAALPALEELDLSGRTLPDGAMRMLREMRTLRVLNLEETNITDQDLADIGQLDVNELYLSSTRITDEGLMYLSYLAHPKESGEAGVIMVGVYDTSVTSEGIDNLKSTGGEWDIGSDLQ